MNRRGFFGMLLSGPAALLGFKPSRPGTCPPTEERERKFPLRYIGEIKFGPPVVLKPGMTYRESG